MTDHLQHIKPGDSIPAATINKLIDGAKIALGSQKSGGGAMPGVDVSNTVIRTRVKTDKPLPRYAVVSIDAALIDPDKNRSAFLQAPAIRAGRPNADTANFAILQRPASPNQIVPACVSGVSIVELTVESEEHQFAVPNDSYTMTSAESGGAKILWKQDEPGDDGKIWALVLFPTGGSGTAAAASPSRVRLVQRKELFPACEYKSLQDVHGCTLEYSDDNVEWNSVKEFNIVGGRVQVNHTSDDEEPHKYSPFQKICNIFACHLALAMLKCFYGWIRCLFYI